MNEQKEMRVEGIATAGLAIPVRGAPVSNGDLAK